MSNNKSKTFMIFGILTLIITIIVSSSYAWYVWTTDSKDTIKIVTGVGSAKVYFDGGSDISANLRPVSDKTKGIVKNISIKADTSNLTFNLYLDINSIDVELKHSSFRYALYQGETKKTEGNFASFTAVTCTKNSTNHIVLLDNESISTTETIYTLYIWIDGENEVNPSSMMNKTFSFNLHADGEGAVVKEPVNLATYITNLYTNADKTEVTNNSITYNYATSVSLMNDRLGGTTEDYDSGNIRYYGASPNNYIYFNCSDYSNQTSDTCELWRIIGVFDGKVKLIRNEVIGEYAYDNKLSGVGTSTSIYGSNDWTDSRLMIMLNPTEYSSSFGTNIYAYDKGSYWYGLNSTCYAGVSSGTKACDFTSTGLKNDTTRNMISEETYSLLGWNSSEVYLNEIYNYERTTGSVYSGHSTSWTGKVAIAYPSDYGYAADAIGKNYYYNKQLNIYTYSGNWIGGILSTTRSSWLLTPFSDRYNYPFYVHQSGNLDSAYYTYVAFGVAPVLYLNSELRVETGTGESESPYRILLTDSFL